MEDYEVRLVMNKIRYPLLVPNFGFTVINRTLEYQDRRLKVDLENRGTVRAIDIGFHLWWPIGISHRSRGNEIGDRGEEIIADRKFKHFVIQGFGSSLVIFPREVHPLIVPDMGPLHIEYIWVKKAHEVSDLRLVWKLYAGDAPPQEGEVSFMHLSEP